jgi:acetyl-CoA carboxylase biotin carboxyl carrier protein
MNIKELKELIELIQKNPIAELEIEKSGIRVKIKKESLIQTPLPSAPIETVAHSEKTAVEKEPLPARSLQEQEGMVTVTAPVVGTFYRSPTPDAVPYVEIGTLVKKGQVLCVIEAMKLMNEIEAECDGRISVILVENAQSVEYGQPLFLIDPITSVPK